MYARVVRFTDVDSGRIDEIVQRTSTAEGPPEGVDSTAFKLFYDASQGTAVFVGFFDTEEKMIEGGKVLSAMDASEVPGTRASVDNCEVKVERSIDE